MMHPIKILRRGIFVACALAFATLAQTAHAQHGGGGGFHGGGGMGMGGGFHGGGMGMGGFHGNDGHFHGNDGHFHGGCCFGGGFFPFFGFYPSVPYYYPPTYYSYYPPPPGYYPPPQGYYPQSYQSSPAGAAPASYAVFFALNSDRLSNDARATVQHAATAFHSQVGVPVAVMGFADRAGTAAHNDALSQRRAQSVKAALIQDGVPDRAISVSWHGENNPAVPTPNGVPEAQNRRVVIVIGAPPTS